MPDDGGYARTLHRSKLEPIGADRIPPRPWAYGSFLLFGSAAVIGAVDGGGKGAISVVMMLATITGRPLLGERIWRTGPVAIVSYEDDETEWHRRIAAACIHYQLDYDAVLRSVHFIHNPSGRVSFAASVDGFVTYPDGAAIIEQLKAIGAAMMLIDPFNHAHNLDDGNNNAMIAKVAGEMSRIARESDAAVLVLHHLRKGSAGNPDDLMGATSLRATFRSCRILARMTPEVAEKMNIPDPWRYIRIAGSKENYAPPPEKASWFKLIGVPLNNATAEYPDGDEIGVATVWQARPMFEGMDAAALASVFSVLRRSDHSPNKQAKHTPWAGKPLMDIGGRAEREASRIIAAWIESGVLVKSKYYHDASKHSVERVTVDDAKAAEILAEIGVVNALTD
ncbi:AAA family ATPase [Rhodopila sp.]|uniref:AAA family ATPase n=1 Tax=Rhodopila sp. TaxID=2480087 RepID=UPI003D09E70B